MFGISFKKLFGYSFLLLIVFVCSVIVNLPAKFAIEQLPRINGLTISGVSGSLWQGTAKRVTWQQYGFGEVNWDLQVWKLFQGKAELNVRLGRNSELDLTGRGTIGYGFSGPYASNLVLSMPAKQVLKHVTIPAPVTADGQLDLVLKDYEYASPWCKTGTANLVWNQSKVSSPLGDLDLGTIISDVNCVDSQLSAKGSQETAQVSSQFSASLSPSMTYDLDAWFKPGAEFPKKLGDQLQWLGKPDGEGHYPFVYSGKL
ncbi:general secretion pathway protein GspN [Vibrio sp. UCD-FRSSP16_10]|uniref:type II secretion system protein N n=1 Tax=unclassified Vibrio TaxID=2614977 RepID=UPI0007FD183E|nr:MULTISPECIES: type II secretion system protein N [unclassified Vibrio]OBT10138.1 general secretion pathway protein GspN [Vibrio sp. UCD-FRSSP16_30]OBT18928.1 general secretion pathway protein GspN [Vibrio sp. UCD-FRSSP16_10]